MDSQPSLSSLATQLGRKLFRYLLQVYQTKWFRTFVTLAILTFCSIYLINHAMQFNTSVRFSELNFKEITISTGLIILAVFTGSVAWYLIIKSTNQPIPFLEAIKIHLYANISKYLPGIGWQYISKFFQLNKHQLNKKTIGSILAIELILIIISGLAVAIFLFPWQQTPFIFVFTKLATIMVLLAIPLILQARWTSKIFGFRIKPVPIILSIVIFAFNWNLLGLSMWHLTQALGHPGELDIIIYTSVVTISFIVGILVLPVPGGIGVREGMLVFLLSKFSTSIPVEYLAGISRLQIIIGELVMAGIIWIINYFVKDNTKALLKE